MGCGWDVSASLGLQINHCLGGNVIRNTLIALVGCLAGILLWNKGDIDMGGLIFSLLVCVALVNVVGLVILFLTGEGE